MSSPPPPGPREDTAAILTRASSPIIESDETVRLPASGRSWLVPALGGAAALLGLLTVAAFTLLSGETPPPQASLDAPSAAPLAPAAEPEAPPPEPVAQAPEPVAQAPEPVAVAPAAAPPAPAPEPAPTEDAPPPEEVAPPAEAPPEEEAPPAREEAPPEAEPPPAGPTHPLSIRVLPPQARITLDGEEVPNPYEGPIEEGRTVEIIASARRRYPARRRVRIVGPRVVRIRLERR